MRTTDAGEGRLAIRRATNTNVRPSQLLSRYSVVPPSWPIQNCCHPPVAALYALRLLPTCPRADVQFSSSAQEPLTTCTLLEPTIGPFATFGRTSQSPTQK